MDKYDDSVKSLAARPGAWYLGQAVAQILGLIPQIKNLTDNPKDPINEPEVKSFILYWIIILVLAGLWEVIENTILYMVDIKVKFDSAANIITDITIWGIGGCVSWYMTDLMFLSDKYLRAYYIYGFMSLSMGLIIFVFFGFITTNY